MSINDRQIKPVTPGEVLKNVLEDTETTLERFAELTEIPLDDLKAIVDNKKPIAQDTAEAIGKALFTRAQLWLDLQAKIDRWDKDERAIVYNTTDVTDKIQQ